MERHCTLFFTSHQWRELGMIKSMKISFTAQQREIFLSIKTIEISNLYTMRICDPCLRQMDAGELGMMNWQYISFAEIVSSLKFTQIFKNFRNLFYGFSNFLWWGGKGCNFSKKLAGGQSGTRLWDTAKYFHLYHFLKLLIRIVGPGWNLPDLDLNREKNWTRILP